MKKIIRNIVVLSFLLILLIINIFAANKNCKYEASKEGSDKVEFRTKDYARNFITLIIYQNYEEAYNMLTDDCKEEIAGNDLQKFKDLMKEKVYEYGKIPKTFYYYDPVECASEQEKIYSQIVNIQHASLGSMEIDFNSMPYDIYEYTKVSSINFIIYEYGPYDYKISLQLIED